MIENNLLYLIAGFVSTYLSLEVAWHNTVCRIKEDKKIRPCVSSVIELARTTNVPIFFTRHQLLPTRFESSARLGIISKLGLDRIIQTATKEDLDFAIKPKPQQEQQQQAEIVINKHTASIFIDTGFEHMLQSAGIITVVFTGIATVKDYMDQVMRETSSLSKDKKRE
jgi:nicotinamidase-related amidase